MYVNTAGLKALPKAKYALFVISKKVLSVHPCSEGACDAVPIRSGGANRNSPHHIRCRADFTAEILSLMAWRSDCRYKIRGAINMMENQKILTFDLTAAKEIAYV
ncbi:MAG: hypothetical protein FWB96_07975 [Defluviitaleaceae bacterium]|nr:hypothetical protein [Defluviitaleaceae bacterium]